MPFDLTTVLSFCQNMFQLVRQTVAPIKHNDLFYYLRLINVSL